VSASNPATSPQRGRGPIANAATLLPRPHPSTAMYLQLAFASLIAGAITGIPALLLARLVHREYLEARGRYTDAHAKPWAAACAWGGTLVSCFGVLWLVASGWEPLGWCLLGLGVLAGLAIAAGEGALKPFVSLSHRTRAAPVLVTAVLVGLMVTGATGVAAARASAARARDEAALACGRDRQRADELLGGGHFGDALEALRDARAVCVGANLAGLPATNERVLRAREDAVVREAAEAKARAAKEAAERAKALEVSWTAEADVARQRVEHAESVAKVRNWADATRDLDVAEARLSGFRSTPIEASAVWRDLSRRIAELRVRLAPELERIRLLDAAKQRQLAAVEEAKRKAEEATEAARARSENRELVCGDGSISGCACAGSHRGCCSHHGGVAGCR
jgi:hypothetical protein